MNQPELINDQHIRRNVVPAEHLAMEIFAD